MSAKCFVAVSREACCVPTAKQSSTTVTNQPTKRNKTKQNKDFTLNGSNTLFQSETFAQHSSQLEAQQM